MFNISVTNIVVETIVYIIISLIAKIILSDEDLLVIRRSLLIGYLVFSSLFVSLVVYIFVSVGVLLTAFFLRYALDQ